MARSFTYVVSAVKCDALRRIELSVSPSAHVHRAGYTIVTWAKLRLCVLYFYV